MDETQYNPTEKLEVRIILTKGDEPMIIFSGDVIDTYYLIGLFTGDPVAEQLNVNKAIVPHLKAISKVFAYASTVMVWNCTESEVEAEYERVVPYTIDNGTNTTAYGDYIRTR